MTDFKNVPIKQIKPDPNQPRKFYEEQSMQELSASIKEKGVLQPILLRPNGKGYLIVCGERRFKASVAAGLTEMPAIVRELSNEEALELQIIENLQRKDVHPMEEAVAFKSLSEKLSPEEIALRVGKSASYVAKRVKLTDLIDDVQEIFYSNHMTFSDALLMSRLEPGVQKEIFKERVPKNWKNKKEDWSIGNIQWYVNNQQLELSGSAFKTTDANIYPEAGACNKCPYNSANQPLLFDDQKKSICTRPSCYEIKTQRAKKLKFEKVAANPDKICICPDSYLSDNEKQDLELAKESGIQVLNKNFYERVYGEPDVLQSYEEWFEDNYGWMDDDDDKPSDSELQKEYQEYKEENEKDAAEYEDAIKNGRLIKAYVVAGNESGKEVAIKLKSTAADAVASSTGNAGDAEIFNEVARIKERESRNKELDAEKIWQQIIVLAREDEAGLLKNSGSLQLSEIKAFRTAVDVTTGHTYRKHIDNLFDKDHNLNELNLYSLCRLLILDKLINNYQSHIGNYHNGVAFDFIKSILPDEVSRIELEQKEKANARAERVGKRIAALEKKLSTETSKD